MRETVYRSGRSPRLVALLVVVATLGACKDENILARNRRAADQAAALRDREAARKAGITPTSVRRPSPRYGGVLQWSGHPADAGGIWMELVEVDGLPRVYVTRDGAPIPTASRDNLGGRIMFQRYRSYTDETIPIEIGQVAPKDGNPGEYFVQGKSALPGDCIVQVELKLVNSTYTTYFTRGRGNGH